MNKRALPLTSGRLLAIVLALALGLRLLTAFYLGDVAEPVSGAYDQVSYDMLAQRVLSAHGFSFPQDWYPFTLAGEQTAHWSFAYTLFLSGVYALTGHHPLAARLIQALLSGLTGWYLYRLGRRLLGQTAGLVAASLWAFYAYLIFFNAVLMTQTFYIICVLAALDLALELASRSRVQATESLTSGQPPSSPPRRSVQGREAWTSAQPASSPPRHGVQGGEAWTRWLALGLALGLGTLLRQTLLLFAPLLLLWVVWQRWQSGRAEPGRAEKRMAAWLGGPLVSVVTLAACVLPFTAYNYATFHDFLLLNSNGGFFFWASNHPTQGTNFDPNYVPPLPAALVAVPEPALDRELYREALGFILSDPVRFIQLSVNRMKDYFWVLPSDQSSALSNLARTLSFALYAPFMLVGLLWSRRAWRLCLPLYLYLAFDTLLHLSSWAAPRYRLPSDTILMLFAALCLMRLASSPRAAVVRSAAARWLGRPVAGERGI